MQINRKKNKFQVCMQDNKKKWNFVDFFLEIVENIYSTILVTFSR